jgi:hypothetical protein
MITFEGEPFLLDVIYLKVKPEGSKTELTLLSIPFVEALGILNNVTFDYRASRAKTIESAEVQYVITGDTEKEKNKTFVVSKQDLIKRLQLDIYEDKQRIVDLVIQPMDELVTDEVEKFIAI